MRHPGALVVAAMDRGNQEYRIRVADTHIVVVPSLAAQRDVDLVDLALRDIEFPVGGKSESM